MKAYKASHNGTCETLTYEVGKTYTFNGTIELCAKGFHCCKNLKDVFNYYNNNANDLVIFEVEVLGSAIEENDKLVTDKMKIVRILDKNEYKEFLTVKEYDKNGNVIYWCSPNSHNYQWNEYDQNNNLIHLKSSSGFECWYEYDKNNNMVRCKNNNGYEIWYKYDQNNKVIYYKDSDDIECQYKYDQNNNAIYYKHITKNEIFESRREYNENNKEIYCECSNGFEFWKEWDKNNNLIYYKDSNNVEMWSEYDRNNNLIHYKDKRTEWSITIE